MDEYAAVVRKFYEVYRPIGRRYNLRVHSRFSMNRPGCGTCSPALFCRPQQSIRREEISLHIPGKPHTQRQPLRTERIKGDGMPRGGHADSFPARFVPTGFWRTAPESFSKRTCSASADTTRILTGQHPEQSQNPRRCGRRIPCWPQTRMAREKRLSPASACKSSRTVPCSLSACWQNPAGAHR